MKVSVSQPVYLDSYYDNIVKDASWNQEVAATLATIAAKLGDTPNDVLDFEIEKDEDLPDLADATGYVGYSTRSAEATDYFYVDFRLETTIDKIAQAPEELTKALLLELAEYATSHSEFSLVKTKLEEGDFNESFLLRAYFISRDE
jgi:hypothetical protein